MTANLTRRAAIVGGLTTTLIPAGPLAAATSATRRLELFRGDARIGEQTIAVSRSGSDVSVEIAIDIDVRIVGLPVYGYTLQARETWSNGALVALSARTDDNGTAQSVEATGAGGRIEVRGSAFTGTVEGNPATTSYWTPAFLERRVWISTQDGRPLQITARPTGDVRYPAAGGDTVAATRWRITGELDGLDLYYDRSGEWVGSEFMARGETARFLVAERGAALSPLWVSA